MQFIRKPDAPNDAQAIVAAAVLPDLKAQLDKLAAGVADGNLVPGQDVNEVKDDAYTALVVALCEFLELELPTGWVIQIIES